MSKHKSKVNPMVQSAANMVGGGMTMSVGSLALSSMPATGAGTAALGGLNTMAGFMPTIGTVQGGGMVMGEMGNLLKQTKKVK